VQVFDLVEDTHLVRREAALERRVQLRRVGRPIVLNADPQPVAVARRDVVAGKAEAGRGDQVQFGERGVRVGRVVGILWDARLPPWPGGEEADALVAHADYRGVAVLDRLRPACRPECRAAAPPTASPRAAVAPTAGRATRKAELATLPRPVRAATGAGGLLPHALLLIEAERAGLGEADLDVTFVGSLPDVNAALRNNAIDLGTSGEPLITLGEQQGILARWRLLSDLYPDLPFSTCSTAPACWSATASPASG
jgi:hypothetical protein